MSLDKYSHIEIEDQIFSYWEKNNLFKPVKNKMATWRNGYAEDCKSLYPGSIPGVASKKTIEISLKKSKF